MCILLGEWIVVIYCWLIDNYIFLDSLIKLRTGYIRMIDFIRVCKLLVRSDRYVDK